MLVWLLVLTIFMVVLFVACGIAAWYMFGRPSQISLRKELRGEIPTSVYPIDLKRVPPPSKPQRGIPKQIFRTWEDDSWKTSYRQAYDHTAKIVPDWPQKVFTSKDRRKFVHETFAKYPDIVDAYELCNYGVMEADLWRYLVIYHYGGLYLDMKSSVMKPIDLDLDVDKAYVCTWDSVHHKYLFGGMGEYAQWHILAPPKSEFLWKVIWQVVRNILYLRDHVNKADFLELGMSKATRYQILGTTGPFVYTYVGHKYPYMVSKLDYNVNGFVEYKIGNDYTNHSKGHYSKKTKPLVNEQVTRTQLSRPLKLGKVPKVLHMTYINKESVPQFVWDNLKKYTRGYEVKFYSDEDCDFYLWKYYGPQVLESWYMQEKGAHKADLFRYAVLAREGGVYLDIKIDVRQPLGEMFDHDVPFTSVETRQRNHRNIHNAILASSPGHPVMYNALAKACVGDKNKWAEYATNIDYLHKLLRMEMDGKELNIGLNVGRRGPFVLHEEVFKQGGDRYGFDNLITRHDGVVLAHSRYFSFPWKKKLSQKVEIKNYRAKNPDNSFLVPPEIYQTHESRWVTPGLANAIRKLQTHAPGFSYTFFDAQDRRNFIEKHYPRALKAYDSVVPGTWKADIFRIVLIYTKGGVYVDSPIHPISSNTTLTDTLVENDEFLAPIDTHSNNGILCGWMCSRPKHPLLKQTLDLVIDNVTHKRLYHFDKHGSLRVTGPLVYKDAFQLMYSQSNIMNTSNIRLLHFATGHPFYRGIISQHNRPLYATRYANYDIDRKIHDNIGVSYTELWRRGRVFI